MKRFVLPVLALTLTLLLSACGAGDTDNKAKGTDTWGNLKVTLQNIQQTETQWTANLAIQNPTDKIQVIQYRGASRYTMIITRDGKEILRQNIDPIDPTKAETVNLSAGVTRKHVVAWTYRNNEGQRVEAGNYQLSVVLNALTAIPNEQKTEEQIFSPPTVGPVTVTVK